MWTNRNLLLDAITRHRRTKRRMVAAPEKKRIERLIQKLRRELRAFDRAREPTQPQRLPTPKQIERSKRKAIVGNAILAFLNHAGRLDDNQIVFAVKKIAPHATRGQIIAEREALVSDGQIKRTGLMRRIKNGRLLKLWQRSDHETQRAADPRTKNALRHANDRPR